jgi:WD40 repeat protein
MRPHIQIEKTDTYSGHIDCIYALSPALDEQEFYTAGGDGMVVKWNLNTPDHGTLITKLENSIYAMKLIPERKLLVICENLKGIRFLDIVSGKEVANIPLPEYTFFEIEYHKDLLLVATHTGKVLLYHLETLAPIKTLDYSHMSARCIALNVENNEFAVGFSDHSIRIFSLDEFQLKFELKKHTNSVFTLQYDAKGEYLLSAGRDAMINYWDTKAGYLNLKSIPAHLFAINHLQYRPDCKYFATCSMDKSIKIWDAQSLSLLKVIDKSRHAGHGTSINKLLWKEQALISVSDDRKVYVWKIGIESL